MSLARNLANLVKGLFVNTSGNVGIGTSSPSYPITIYSDGTGLSTAQTYQTGDGVTTGSNLAYYGTNTTAPQIQFVKGRGTSDSPTTTAANDGVGLIRYQAHDGGSLREIARIGCNVESATGSDNIAGFLRFYTRPAGAAGALLERMRIDSSGNLLVGTTSATSGYLLKVAGGIYGNGNHNFAYSSNELNLSGANQATADVYVNYRNSATTITNYRFMNGAGLGAYASCVAVAFNPSSDYRIKSDVQDEPAALGKVLTLRPVNYLKDGAPDREHGLIAHEVAEIFPYLVGGEGKDAVDEEGDMVVQTVNYMGLTSILVKAIQEQQALITSLTERIAALEAA